MAERGIPIGRAVILAAMSGPPDDAAKDQPPSDGQGTYAHSLDDHPPRRPEPWMRVEDDRAAPAPSPPPVVGARGLLGASLDLLTHFGAPMRRASFYVGLIALGLIGPLAIALWGSAVLGASLDLAAFEEEIPPAWIVWFSILAMLASAGFFVSVIESQGVAIALLGARWIGRPISVPEAIQRSRMAFWSLVVAGLVIGVPVSIVQEMLSAAVGAETPAAILGVALVGIAIQTPFVYAPAGIVLGGVGPIEALRRSVRVFSVRKSAALLVAVLPTLFGLVLLFGLGAGLDILVRVASAFGLGVDSGPVGLTVVTVLVVMGVFALGTLLYTAAAIIYAPQVVMFVSLTHATHGLDVVRPGGSHAVERHGDGHPPFRWLTRPMLAGIVLGAVSLVALLATLRG
jgi:hypothetical protein